MSPQYIENQLRFCDFIGNAVVFGAGRDFVSALITIDNEKVGGFLEKSDENIPVDEEISQQDIVANLLEREINSINTILSDDTDNSGLKIEKFVVIPGQFSSANGEFTQMGKLRRGFVTDKYNKLIDAIYGGKDAVDAKASKNFGLKSAIKIRKL